MSTMISEVYDAFLSVGVPDDKARRAAQALSAENVPTKGDMQEMKGDIQELKAELRLIKWMLGFVLAFCLTMLPMMFSIMWKLFADP